MCGIIPGRGGVTMRRQEDVPSLPPQYIYLFAISIERIGYLRMQEHVVCQPGIVDDDGPDQVIEMFLARVLLDASVNLVQSGVTYEIDVVVLFR
jgi:hypothetical protein